MKLIQGITALTVTAVHCSKTSQLACQVAVLAALRYRLCFTVFFVTFSLYALIDHPSLCYLLCFRA
jgi:hypothetical protein